MKTKSLFQRVVTRGVVAMVLASMIGSSSLMGCAVEASDASPSTTTALCADEAPVADVPEAEELGSEDAAAGGSWFSFGTKGVEMGAYNTMPGYSITYQCEDHADYTVKSSPNARIVSDRCELKAGLFGNRTVRMIVSRDSDGKRVWEQSVRINPNSGTVNDYGPFKDEDSLSISIDGGKARLSAAFYSPGGIMDGDLAEERMQAAMYLTPSHVSWMSTMPSSLKAAPMSRWIFPGSHDAGMFSSGGAITNYTKTQSQDIRGQLELGIRYFDIRPGVDRGAFGPVQGMWMVHGPTAGGSYRQAMNDTVRFLNSPEGKNEIVVIALSSDGISFPFRPARNEEIRAELDRVLAEHQGNAVNVGDASDFNKSYDQLVASGRRLIVDSIHRWNTLNSYDDDGYKSAWRVPGIVYKTADACRVRSSGIGTVLQLQSTSGSLTTPTLLGNKLVLDRYSYNYIATGGANGCKGGPTFIQNDYVDTALTDVVVRANRLTKP